MGVAVGGMGVGVGVLPGGVPAYIIVNWFDEPQLKILFPLEESEGLIFDVLQSKEIVPVPEFLFGLTLNVTRLPVPGLLSSV